MNSKQNSSQSRPVFLRLLGGFFGGIAGAVVGVVAGAIFGIVLIIPNMLVLGFYKPFTPIEMGKDREGIIHYNSSIPLRIIAFPFRMALGLIRGFLTPIGSVGNGLFFGVGVGAVLAATTKAEKGVVGKLVTEVSALLKGIFMSAYYIGKELEFVLNKAEKPKYTGIKIPPTGSEKDSLIAEDAMIAEEKNKPSDIPANLSQSGMFSKSLPAVSEGQDAQSLLFDIAQFEDEVTEVKDFVAVGDFVAAKVSMEYATGYLKTIVENEQKIDLLPKNEVDTYLKFKKDYDALVADPRLEVVSPGFKKQ